MLGKFYIRLHLKLVVENRKNVHSKKNSQEGRSSRRCLRHIPGNLVTNSKNPGFPLQLFFFTSKVLHESLSRSKSFSPKIFTFFNVNIGYHVWRNEASKIDYIIIEITYVLNPSRTLFSRSKQKIALITTFTAVKSCSSVI